MRKWSREDIIVALALYCVTPTSKMNPSNKTIQAVAQVMGFSLRSLTARMQNFRAADPRQVSSLGHIAKIDRAIYEEFRHDWGELSAQAEAITGLALFDADPVKGAQRISSLTDRNKVNRERAFFRGSVLAAYDYRCCISGQTLPAMLVASHIKPYRKCRGSEDRVNPENGLCLNVFYDKAFDQGFITIEPDLTIRVSPRAHEFPDAFTTRWLLDLQGESILLPDRFRPRAEFLEYHNREIFKE